MTPPTPPRSLPPALWALALGVALHPGCTCTELPAAAPASAAAAITAPFADDFDRPTLGPDWRATDAATTRIENGELVISMGHNHPVWLARALPRSARIEFDGWSNDDAGDIKVEAWGDGRSFATDLVGQYTSTAYNFIFGGWHNQLSTLARMHEHGNDRQSRADVRVVKGQRYHFTIERRGAALSFLIDGKPFLAFDDPAPLEGEGHAYFAFTDWEAELHFDHLRITPL